MGGTTRQGTALLLSVLVAAAALVVDCSRQAPNLKDANPSVAAAAEIFRGQPIQWGDVKKLSSDARRSLLPGAADARGEGVYVVGFAPKDEQAVASTLEAMSRGAGDIIIMQQASDNSWLVQASLEDLQELQATIPSVTVALVPKETKASKEVVFLLGNQGTAGAASVQGFGATNSGGASATSGGVGAPQPPPPWVQQLKDLDTSTTSDGRLQVVLGLQRGPFISLGDLAGRRDEAAIAAAEARAEEWAADFAQRLADALALSPEDPCLPEVVPQWVVGGASVRVCAEQAPDAVQWLLEQQAVVNVELGRSKRSLDLHANVALQGEELSAALTGAASTHLSLVPFWQSGLTGKGQVTGVTDTGIAMDSCYFWDPGFPDFLTNEDNIETSRLHDFEHFTSSEHRKVENYFFYKDPEAKDATDHGSHVASLLAGSAYGFDATVKPDYATGIAPEARISFFDIEDDEDAKNDVLSLPPGVQMFNAMYDKGARIITNSWGGTLGEYGAYCRLLDVYTWYLQDLLLLAAAGNAGREESSQSLLTGTINNPGTCKNIVSVGATENWSGPRDTQINLLNSEGQQIDPPAGFFSATSEETYALEFKGLDGNNIERSKLVLHFPETVVDWGGRADLFQTLSQSTDFVVEAAGPAPYTACPSNTLADGTGKVLLFVQTSDCGNDAQANNVADNAVAAAGIMVSTTDSLSSVPTASHTDTTTPFGFVASTAGTKLFDMVTASGMTVRMRVFKVSPQDNVASFSSFGAINANNPAQEQDLRIQPTIMAPGTTLSSKPDAYTGTMDSCAVSTLSGSSMATPVVAGMATIIRQYFMDGFYPTGTKVDGSGFQPTAALLMAMLVGGAESMVGRREGELLSPAPSQYQGFGRAGIQHLPVSGFTDARWKLQVIQRAAFTTNSTRQSYKVTATGDAPLIVTLAYLDWPADAVSHQPLLVNDLDLSVKGPGGEVSWGNGVANGDRLNNVEKVVIEYPAAGEYTVDIDARFLFFAAVPQPYSIAVMGGVSNTISSPFNPANGELDTALESNEAMVHVTFSFPDGSKADPIANQSSADFSFFKTETLETFQAKMPNGWDVQLVSAVIETRIETSAQATSSRFKPLGRSSPGGSKSSSSSSGIGSSPQDGGRKLQQTRADVVARYKFIGTPASITRPELAAAINENAGKGFPLESISDVSAYFGSSFTAEFGVDNVDGYIVETSVTIDDVVGSPQEEAPDDGADTSVVGAMALLGGFLLALAL